MMGIMIAVALVAGNTGRNGPDAAAIARTAMAQSRTVMIDDPSKADALARRWLGVVRRLPAGRERDAAESQVTLIIGEAQSRMGHYELAGRVIDRSYRLGAQAGDDKAMADALISRSNMRASNNEMGAALTDALHAISTYRRIGESRSQSVALQDLAMIYLGAEDYARSLRYMREAGEVYKDDPVLSMSLLANTASLLERMGRPKDAEMENRKAYAIARERGFYNVQLSVLTNIAQNQLEMGRMGNAEAAVRRAITLAQRHGIRLTPALLETMAKVARIGGRPQDAVALADRAVAIIGDPPSYEAENEAYLDHKAAGQTAEALRHFERAAQIRTRATQMVIAAGNSLMAARFDATNQDLRITRINGERLRQGINDERRNNELMMQAATVISLILVSWLIMGYRTRRRMRAMNEDLKNALEDVRNHRVAEEQADLLSRRDMLTDLPNRRDLRDEMATRSKERQNTGVLLIDLDRFKPINDIHGHKVGDAVLIAVADRLRAICRAYAAKPFRIGGDEFVITLDDPEGQSRPERLAQDVIHSITQPYDVEDLGLTIGVSVGISGRPGDGTTMEELLRAADMAMYEAKHSGRRTYRRYDTRMQERLTKRAQTEIDLRAAIHDDAIVAAFQPIHSLADDRIACFETLARWTHPVQGAIPPDDFIPVAEEIGLIDEITMSMLRQGCRAARTWPDHIGLAINVSPTQMNDSAMAAQLLSIIRQEDVDPARIIVEITESAVVQDEEAFTRTMEILRQAGVRIALDDFGKGYSSLTQLRTLAFDCLKLDASFVLNLANEDSMKITTAVAGLAQAMEIPVTAEGVETEEAAETLRMLGFDHAQGYLYGRPMDADHAKAVAWAGADHLERAA